MDFVFGSTLICHDAETAKRVTFDPNVRLKSVTLEGDVYDPSGTLSGGSAPNSNGVLVTLQKLHEVTEELNDKMRQLQELENIMGRENKKLMEARGLKQQYDLKLHEIKLTEDQINSNASSSIIQAVEQMKVDIEKYKTDIKEAKVRATDAAKDVKRIEKDINDFKNNKDSKLAELQKTVDTLKKSVAKKSQGMKTLQKEFQNAQLEFEQAGIDLSAAKEALEDETANLSALEEELAGMRKEYTSLKSAHEISLAHLSDEKAKLSGFDDELGELENAIRSKSARITEEGLERQKLSHELDKLQKELTGAQSAVATMEAENEWIEEAKEYFGKPGTPYDFNNVNISECRSSLKNLNERFAGMKKKINPKVMNMIDSVEKKEVALKNMLKTVNRDKRKIEETIATLDEYKKEALDKTWKKVTTDFGNIFADLLPGSFAKLEPPEGKDITQGLEVKVRLGQIWKQSLTELSGGQRYPPLIFLNSVY